MRQAARRALLFFVAGIRHRVWMTGNQPGQDNVLPRPALLPSVPLGEMIELLFY